jgi:D-amino-acid oxidase
VQALTGGDMRGYGEDNLVPDRAEAEEAVATLAVLYASFGQARETA